MKFLDEYRDGAAVAKLVRAIEHFERRDAHRTAGAVHQLDGRRQHLVDAVFDDGVRLAAAHFHDGPRSCDAAADRLGQLAGCLAIAILVEIFHVDGAWSSSS